MSKVMPGTCDLRPDLTKERSENREGWVAGAERHVPWFPRAMRFMTEVEMPRMRSRSKREGAVSSAPACAMFESGRPSRLTLATRGRQLLQRRHRGLKDSGGAADGGV